MLYATKRELHAELAKDILEVRNRELQYYTNNINNIGLQASLLAGFAFQTLANHESADQLSWLRDYTQDSFVVLTFALQPQQQMQVVLELFYLTSTISAMGSTLYTLYICLISTILGPGLALRGPEGSVDRAVLGLARVNRKVIQSFAFALNLFQFSILVNSFLNFHVIAAIVCALFVIYYMYTIAKYGNSLTQEFFIPPTNIISGRFHQHEGASTATQTGDAPKPVAEPDLFPPLTEAAMDLAPKVIKKQFRKNEYEEKEKRKAAMKGVREDSVAEPTAEQLSHRPSHIAGNMMWAQQGPMPDKDPVAADILAKPAENTSWVATLFGGGGDGGRARKTAKGSNGSRESAGSGASSSASVSTDRSAKAADAPNESTAKRKGTAADAGAAHTATGAKSPSASSRPGRPVPPPSGTARAQQPKVATTPLIKAANKMQV